MLRFLYKYGARGLLLSQICFCLLSFGNSPRTYLDQLGFEPLEAPPLPFTLPNLSGKQSSLSDYQGKWIFIAFWATWCGPCKYELPQLESLYQEFKANNFVVLGVSVDKGPASQVKNFVKSKGLTYPILLDSTGQVSARYRASAIPTIYVISPEWQIVGMFRGAKSWEGSETLNSLRKLLQAPIKKGPTLVQNKPPASAGPNDTLELPNNLEPPSLELSFLKKATHFRLGQNPTAQLKVRWPGSSSQYLIKVPKITLPENVRQLAMQSSTSSSTGYSELLYEIPLEIEEAGSYEIGPVELAYQPRSGGKELFTRVAGLSIEVSRPNLIPLYIASSLALLLAAGFFFWLRKSKAPVAVTGAATPDWESRYQAIKRLKVDGSKAEYVEALLKLYRDVCQDASVSEIIEKIRYSGVSLPEEKIRFYEKSLESSLREAG